MLLVNGKATCSRLVVKIITASQWPLVQGKAICPISKSRLFVRGHFVRGYFVRGKAACQSQDCCQWPLAQAKASLPTAASAVWRGSCTGTWDSKGRGERAG